MATKATKTVEEPEVQVAEEPGPAVVPAGQCVVKDGRQHVGRAVNGKVCSAHAVSHRPDGTPRGQ